MFFFIFLLGKDGGDTKKRRICIAQESYIFFLEERLQKHEKPCKRPPKRPLSLHHIWSSFVSPSFCHTSTSFATPKLDFSKLSGDFCWVVPDASLAWIPNSIHQKQNRFCIIIDRYCSLLHHQQENYIEFPRKLQQLPHLRLLGTYFKMLPMVLGFFHRRRWSAHWAN